MATKKSNYAGYVPMTKSGAIIMDDRKAKPADRARGAKYAFDLDKEGMRSSYETYKRDGDPSAKDISKLMEKADEKAIEAVQRAGAESDSEYKREKRRGKTSAMAVGGSVSKRADGVAQRGKTKGRMV